MASKVFELEQVLKYRLEIERLRKHEFASAKRDLEQAHEQLQQQEAYVHDLAREFSQRQRELESIDELRRYVDFLTRKKNDISKQKERVHWLGSVLHERRGVLVDATKDKKVLESLKEKKAQEFRQAMERLEQSFMDEIAIQRNGATD
ncbi:flagellar export protein FliJ [Geobacter sp. SVR]|uniref:flagellar export protein FliJ n=1 Tax=Geobacter sp. SVR TaxID=2495594 RepID=UPI00143EFC50|nr:flagellar export protein FliJ [Geobacter sp. SVR]BCS55824.1 hypothetical protein GSVR_41320 [Geobacter sp. SVR]GCF83828.1 flagellar export protein FliJ [Geobacter sp. SVR]